MLAKITSKNQITLPKAVVAQLPRSEYFEVEAVDGRLMLTPVRAEGRRGARQAGGTGHWRRRRENWGRIKISEITVPAGRWESQALYPHQGHNPAKVRIPFFKEYRCSPR